MLSQSASLCCDRRSGLSCFDGFAGLWEFVGIGEDLSKS